MSAHVSIKQRRRTGLLRRTQHGFSLVSAIFLLVVLAAMGTAMLNIFTVHQASSAMDVQGARAYQAARAGIEWGLYRQLRQEQCSAAPMSFALPATSSLSGFTVTVTCKLTGTLDGAGGALPALDRWVITATACNQPVANTCPDVATSTDPDYVQRVMQVQF